MDLADPRDALSDDLSRVGRGEASALKQVYDKTSAKLFGICLRILGEPSEAEDVLQEVYLTVWRSAATFDRGRASPITWLSTIARNRAIDRLRMRRPERAAPIEAAIAIPDAAPSAQAGLEAAQGSAQLQTCLTELDAPMQSAIRAAFLDGHTYDVLAQRAGVPLGTMKSWIRRSLIKLRACLER